MKKNTQTIILILSLIAMICELWGYWFNINVMVVGPLTSYYTKGGKVFSPAILFTHYYLWFWRIMLYSLFLGSIGLWFSTSVFYRLRWIIGSFLIVSGIYEFFSFWPSDMKSFAFGIPVKIPGLIGAFLSFVLAYLIITTPGLTKGRGR